jgi:hypothetical protein
MWQLIDVAALYQRALDRVPDSIDGLPPLPVPSKTPTTLDEVLRGDPAT